MTEPHHTLTPPPELVEILVGQAFGTLDKADFLQPEKLLEGLTVLATRAAQWGADQELEACCVELAEYCDCGVELTSGRVRELLMELRRPKPPSLKEQALEALDRMDQFPTNKDMQIIRRALEQLQQPEEEQ
jgi:hypothetical protein